jgi:hypothetical protein
MAIRDTSPKSVPQASRSPQAPLPPVPPPKGAGMTDYLREAFLFRWNLLLFLGGAAAAALTPLAPVLLPLVAAGEVTYLTGLVSVPRFRAAIDAKVHAAGRAAAAGGTAAQPPPASLVAMLDGLPATARMRFEKLHARCLEMRGIAAGVRGAAGDQSSAEDIRTPGLDRLLWLFLRLLVSKTALDRFLQSMNEQELISRLADTRASLTAAQAATAAQTAAPGQAGGAGQAADRDRIVKSLQDSVAMSELRLDNYGRAKKNGEFVTIELDRIEAKIQALAEMAVNRQDPDFLTSQVDSAADSMRQTEKAVSELQHLTGLADQFEEPPAILDADLRTVLKA